MILDVNAKLKALRAEAVNEGTNPHFIRLVDQFIRLTNPEDEIAAEEKPEEKPEAAIDATVKAMSQIVQTGPCKHKLGTDVYGRCLSCKECTHTQVTPEGTCKTCGEVVSL